MIRWGGGASKGIAWAAGAGLGLAVAALETPSAAGWAAYILLGAAAGGVVGWLWRRVVGDQPARGLMAAFLVALVLRLAVGGLLLRILPIYGNDVTHHHAGFFFPDAFERDRSAWAIGRTDTSLLEAFNSAKGDQYGGLLFLTAAVYRVFGPEVEPTILPAAIAALSGALAVLFTWGFAASAFGLGAAIVAAWVIALYPDAALLGAQNMREPYVMAGIAAAFYGYASLRKERIRRGAVWIAAGSLLALAVSPPFGLLTGLLVLLAALWEGRAGRFVRRALPLILGALILATVLTVRAWSQIQSLPSDPIAMVSAWWTHGIAYELGTLQRSSSWIEPIFAVLPSWGRLPFVTAYGVLQPFLPAALMDNTGVVLMTVIMVWRALGWFALLPFLLYAPLASVRSAGWRSLPTFLAVVFIFLALAISLRFAGDQWDSPRYRTALLPLVAALVGWAWVHARSQHDPWLKRCVALVVVEVVVVSWWYAGRYYHIPRISFFRTTALAAGIGALLVIAGLVQDRLRERRRA